MDPFDDVVALADLPQGCLRTFVHAPAIRPDLVRQPHGFQTAQAPQLHYREGVRCFARRASEINDTILPRVPLKLAVQLSPAVGVHLPFDRLMDVMIGAWPEFQRHEILGTGAHPLADVIARDHEV